MSSSWSSIQAGNPSVTSARASPLTPTPVSLICRLGRSRIHTAIDLAVVLVIPASVVLPHLPGPAPRSHDSEEIALYAQLAPAAGVAENARRGA
jgi:hypothetical protein